MKLSRQAVIGLSTGVITGLFLGELVAPIKAADGFIRLLQMTVLPPRG
jgi:Na+/H+-dicarboxylate symporter